MSKVKELLEKAKITNVRVIALLYKAKKTKDWSLIDEALKLLGNSK